MYYHVTAWGFTAMENAHERKSFIIGVNDICLMTPPSSKRSCFLMSLFQVPYHISLSLTDSAKGGRRNICTSIWDPGKGCTSNDGTSSMLSVIVSGCPSGLIASRETKKERKLVKIHCKTLTKPMNPDVITALKTSIEKHNRY